MRNHIATVVTDKVRGKLDAAKAAAEALTKGRSAAMQAVEDYAESLLPEMTKKVAEFAAKQGLTWLDHQYNYDGKRSRSLNHAFRTAVSDTDNYAETTNHGKPVNSAKRRRDAEICDEPSRIKAAIEAITAGVFSKRLEPETSSLEFGRIAQGLNRMTDSLEGLMNNLAEKVSEKTAAYEAQNRRLSQLYEITSFFGETHSVEELCDDFAERLMRLTPAEASSIWLLDEAGESLAFAAGSGLHRDTFAAMIEGPVPFPLVAPLLGQTCSADMFLGAARNLLPRVRGSERTLYAFIHPFAVRSGAKDLGVFILYSNTLSAIDADSRRHFESFGSHLGLAIDNQRLIEKDRQYAVVHERNLMAQGLHDSIAQTLSFLNLQVQFLEDGLRKNDRPFVEDSLKLIKEGLQQSYDDVRELLLNFRERLHSESFREAVRIVVQRFEAQSGCRVEVPSYGNQEDLSPRQRLQVIFIIQEALSNVRKHARASRVRIDIESGADYVVSVTDDGQGIDPALLAERQKTHVGMNIMRERASRIGATVEVSSVQPSGTCVRLTIPARERVAH
jgi:two-component system nitrate/nitrite sensor histidine kinase NarX